MTQWPPKKHARMSHVTEVPQAISTNSSEGTDNEGEAMGWFDCNEVRDGEDRVMGKNQREGQQGRYAGKRLL